MDDLGLILKDASERRFEDILENHGEEALKRVREKWIGIPRVPRRGNDRGIGELNSILASWPADLSICHSNPLSGFDCAIVTPAVRARCREGRLRARLGHCDFVLRALAARKMQQAHDFSRCLATEKQVIHAGRSNTSPANSQVAEQVCFPKTRSFESVPHACRHKCSFKPPFARMRPSFSNPVLNEVDPDYRTRLCIRRPLHCALTLLNQQAFFYCVRRASK